MARLKLQHGRTKPRTGRGSGVVEKISRRAKESGSTVFLPDKLELVRMIAMRGADDDEIAETFNVSKDTFQKWRKAYPSFNKALDNGRLSVDAEVVASLFKQTQGYEYEEETTAGKDGNIVTIKRYAKPEFSATKYWLDNRQPEFWKSASTVRHAGGGKGEEPLGVKVETRDELIASIVELISPKPDGVTKPTSGDQRVKR